ncbi:MAG: ATP-binding protein [Rhodospirillaceae bacterium]|nr:ATP-binding protein [Rhodospirillaceae bacterium]
MAATSRCGSSDSRGSSTPRRRRNDCNLSSRLRVSTYSALLVVDEIGYLPVSQDDALLLFQLISARHEKGSTVQTLNKGIKD